MKRWIATCLLAPLACAPGDATAPDQQASHARLKALETRFVSQGAAPWRSGSAIASPWVRRAEHAAGESRVRARTSDVEVGFRLAGADATPFVGEGNVALARRGYRGADRVQIAHEQSIEDFVAFDVAPEREEVVYELDVSRVAGLRLVGGQLELLDGAGTPRLRVPKPWAIDARGTRIEAALAIEGCAVDRDPRGPWGRPVTTPGADACAMHVRWHADHYPLLLDPEWTTTGSLSTPRQQHRSVTLQDGKVLVSGAAVDSELFDPVTETFSNTGGLAPSRTTFGMVLLNDGKAFVVGGNGPIATCAVYDPQTGLYATRASMHLARSYPILSLLPNGRVYVAGGASGYDENGDIFETTAEIYDPVADTFDVQPAAPHGIGGATALSSGDVLIIDAPDLHVYRVQSASFQKVAGLPLFLLERTGAFFQRPNGIAYALVSNRGFRIDTTNLTYSVGVNTAARYFANASAVVDLGARGFLHVASDDVLDANAQIFAPATMAFSPLLPMLQKRKNAAASMLHDGRVLVTGMDPISAELMQPANGDPCTATSDCPSGICSEGVCCDAACTGTCESCRVGGHVGTCTAVSGKAAHGTCGTSADARCGLVCDGIVRDVCRPPTSPCSATCAGTTASIGTCSASGACELAETTCEDNLLCGDDDRCRTECTSDAMCVAGSRCNAERRCVLVADRGEPDASAPSGSSGAAAASSSSGVASSPAPLEDSGCAMLPTPTRAGAAAAFALTLVTLLRRRRPS